MRFGLVTDNLNSDESRKLWEYAQIKFPRTILLDDFTKLFVILKKGELPKILYGSNDISDLDIIMFRSTKKNRVAKSVIAHIFNTLGKNIIDPIDRFPLGFASKVLSSISRHKKGIAPDTYFSFSHNATETLISLLIPNQKFYIKPINGSQNRNTVTANSFRELRDYSRSFSYTYHNELIPLYFQRFIDIDKEYRMFVVNGKVVASMKKLRRENGNIKYKRMKFTRLAEFVVENVSKKGILGVDACQERNGDFFLIEGNRSPMFHYLEDRTGLNIPERIFENIGENNDT